MSRHLVPALFLAFTLVLAGVELLVAGKRQEAIVLSELETFLRFSAGRLAQDLEEPQTPGAAMDSRQVRMPSASLPYLRDAVLVNGTDQIEQATDQRLIGRPIASLDPALQPGLVAAVRKSPAGRLWYDRARRVLWAAHPVRMPSDAETRGIPEPGLVVLRADIRPILDDRWREASRRSLVFLVCAVPLMMGMGWLLKRRRLGLTGHPLSDSESPVPAGPVVPRPLVTGSDELGRMGSSIHSLLQQFSAARDDFTRLLDSLPVPVWKTDLQGRCIYVNRAWLEFTGRAGAEMPESALESAWHPDDRERCVSVLQSSLANGTGCRLEYRLQYRDGGYRRVQDYGQPCYGPAGELRGSIRSCYDLQAIRDRADTALAGSEDCFRSVVENADVGVYLLRDAQLVYGNRRLAAMLGYRPENLAGLPVFELVHPEDVPSVAGALGRLESGEEMLVSSEFRGRRKHGRYGWVAGSGSRIVYRGSPAVIGTVIDVTRRKLAESAARRHEEALRVMLQSIADAVITADARSRITLLNPAAESLTGWRERDARGQSLSRILRLIDVADGQPVRWGSLAPEHSGLSFPGQAYLIGTDGTRRRLAYIASPIRRLPDGPVTGTVVVLHDETEQQTLMEALRDSERRYRALFEANPHPMWVYDRGSLDLLAVNDAALTHYGYTREEFLAMTIVDLRQPEPGSVAGGTQTQRHLCKNGRVIEVDVATHELEFAGRPACVVLAHDVTERRVAEAALQASEARFRALFEQAAVGVAQIQMTSGRITEVNRRCCAILGRSAGEIVGVNVETLIHPDDVPAYREQMRQFGFGGGSEICIEQRWYRPDGAVVWANVVISSMAETSEIAGHYIVVVEDISERKKAEMALRQFQFMVESAHEEIYLIEPGGALAYANAAAARSLGYSAEEMRALRFPEFDIRCGSDFASFFAAYRDGKFSPIETVHRTRDGREVIKELDCSYLTIGDEGYLCGFARDVTERKQAEERLRLAGKVFEAARESIVVIDANRRIIAVNPAFTTMTGYAQQEVLGQDVRILRSERHDDELYASLWQSVEREGAWRGEIWTRRRTGEVCPAMQTIVEVRDPAGALINYVSVATDITSLKLAEERVRRFAYYDALTGLPNRQLLAERARFALAIESARHQQRAVLFLDLDRFKYVNDSLGHQEGDALIREVALRLRGIVRDTDTLSRLGGDEFVLLLSDLGRAGASAMAEGIMAALDRPFVIAGHSFTLTVSIGISLYPHDGRDFETLLRNADTAMYRAKQSGRNTFLFYDPEMNVATLEYLKLMSALRRGVQEGELRTYFQPKVRLSDGQLVGSEALVRWIHPEEGLMLPGHFINAAERTDLIVSIGNWVLEDVCRQLASWREAGLPPLTVAVNLAPRHFGQPGLADQLRHLLQKYGLDPGCLELELTESTLLEAGEETLITLEELKREGVNLAIDDFGVGYSSLSYLKHLPLASLKIDRSFVRDLTSDADDRTIAATVVALGHSLGLKVVAEGVESEQQRDILIDQGCDFAQGYLYSGPLSSAEFAAWWRSRIGQDA